MNNAIPITLEDSAAQAFRFMIEAASATIRK